MIWQSISERVKIELAKNFFSSSFSFREMQKNCFEFHAAYTDRISLRFFLTCARRRPALLLVDDLTSAVRFTTKP